MTIEEAIKQSEDIADANERIADIYKNHDKDFEEARRSTTEYYRQLADWLRELVHLRNITEYLRDFIDCFGSMDSMYYNEDIIKWAEEELRVEMREVNADE